MQKTIILASASPRRIEILKNHNIDVKVIPADVEEYKNPLENPHILCMYNALKKALCVYEQVSEGIIIAADTIVYNGIVIGKPKDKDEAFQILSDLKNKTHSVYTGVSLIDVWTGEKRVFYDRTDVTFSDYTDEDIIKYIDTGEPMDKSGSYSIQGAWSKFITLTVGDFSNVVGLPWEKLRNELRNFGCDINS